MAILDVTMSTGVALPRGPFVLPVLGLRQVLGKLNMMENTTCKHLMLLDICLQTLHLVPSPNP